MVLRLLLSSLLALLLATPAAAADEGIEYTVLARPQPTETGEQIEVLEVFWYACPHCWHLEPKLAQWLAKKPANVAFRRMPAVLGAHWEPHARAFYAAELLGVEDKLHTPLFRAINEQRQRIMTEDALVAFAKGQGIDADAFRQAYDSFFVNMKVKRAAELGKRFGLDGVPAVVVNGKYVTSASQAGGMDQMFAVIDALVAKESAAAPAKASAP